MSATLREAFEAHLALRPAQPLFISPETGSTLGYGDLARQTARLAARLEELGVGPGGVVALYASNGLQTAALFLATTLAGRVVAPMNLLAQPAQLARALDHSGCGVVLVGRGEEEALSGVLALASRAPVPLVFDPDDPDAFADVEPARCGPPAPAADASALLMYTSGTTGTPKGALLTHANLAYAARTVAAWHGLGPGDRCLSALPLYHINGQVIATLTPFVSGGSIVVPRRFSVSQWWSWVERWQPTWLNLVPTIVAYLLSAAEPATSYRFPAVRFARSASAPLPVEQHRAFERTFGIPVIEAMGMTESASVVFCNPQDPARRRYGSPGLPCGVEAKVIDPASERELAAGEVGEICLRGPNVMSRYHDAVEETRRAFTRDGWLRTGDLGHRDADGYYYITGRLKELIIKGGENIAPREIDEALLRHPAVLEAAAVGVPDPAYGEEILACVVPKPGARIETEELRAFCAAQLGRYKTPRYVRVLAELPKGPSGKVQRLRLRELVGKGH